MTVQKHYTAVPPTDTRRQRVRAVLERIDAEGPELYGPPTRNLAIVQLYAEGAAIADLAIKFKVSRGRVDQIITRFLAVRGDDV